MPQIDARLVQALNERLFCYLSGMDVRDWLRLLRENRFAVDPPYWPRAAYVTAESVRTSVYRIREEKVFGAAVAATEIQPPLFILGHARSGTTHLQRLLAADERFASPNVYQVNRPHTFLSTESTRAKRMASWVPKTRPMDGMTLSVDAPEEDEPALALLTRCSPFLERMFPRHRARYRRYVSFRRASAADLSRWKGGFVWFLKKLTWKYGQPLVLKSPYHTARIRLLMELFPGARFLHIHRHPHAVFRSIYHQYMSTMRLNALQRDDPRTFEDHIVERYREVYDAFCDQRPLIPPGHFHELRYEDLKRDPVGELRQAYDALALEWSDELEFKLGRYLNAIHGYRPNIFPELAPAIRRRLAHAWQRSFDEWGYRP